MESVGSRAPTTPELALTATTVKVESVSAVLARAALVHETAMTCYAVGALPRQFLAGEPNATRDVVEATTQRLMEMVKDAGLPPPQWAY